MFVDKHCINIGGGVLNMVNTVIGGGISIIACPYGIRYLGWYGFIICETILGFLTFLSLCLMINVSTHANNKDLSSLVKPLKICGTTLNVKYINKIMDTIIVLNCAAVIIVFLDTMLTVVSNIMDKSNGLVFWLFISITLVLTYSLCLLKNTKSARPASFIAVMFWSSFLTFMYYNVLAMKTHSKTHKHEHNPFIGITAINLSWTCQFKALPVYQNLNTSQDAKKVFFIMFVAALCIYLSLGFAAYYSFSSISDSLINNLQPPFDSDNIALSDTAAYIAQACLAISIFFSNPIFFIEIREHLLLLLDYENWKANSINSLGKCFKTQKLSLQDNDEKDNEPLVDPNMSFKSCKGAASTSYTDNNLLSLQHELKREYSNESGDKSHDHVLPMKERLFPTLIIFLVCVLVVVIGETVLKNKFDLIGTMINFIGGIAANSIAWLIPAMLYFGNRKKYETRSATLLAMILLLVFCVVFASWVLSFFKF